MSKAKYLQAFIDDLSNRPNILEAYDEDVWSYLIDKAIVNRDKSITFQFRNGKEIKILPDDAGLRALEKIANDFPYCSIENEFCDTQDFIDGLEDVLYYRAYDERILELVELSEKPLKFITKKEYSTGVFEVWQDESTLVYYEVDNSFYVGSIRCQTNTLTEEDLREEYNYAV